MTDTAVHPSRNASVDPAPANHRAVSSGGWHRNTRSTAFERRRIVKDG
jgi:hypothetical protein